MKNRVLTALLVLVAAMGSAVTVQASEDSNFSHGGERHLGGHAFMHSQYINDPFISSNFTNFVGAASASTYTRDFYDLNGDLLFTLKGSVVFASLGMKYQQHLGEKWAVGVGGAGLVRSGTNALSFIDDGANVNVNYDAWAKRLLRRGQKSQLTAGLNWHYSSVTYFTPREFAEHLLDGGSLETAPFVVTGKSWSVQADFLWAYAFNSMYAIRATGSFGVVERYGNSGVFMGKNKVGVLGEVDFKARHSFPLGITLGHFVALPLDKLQSGTSGTVLGFWFTGREDFLIGLETGWLEIPLSDGGDTVDGAFGAINIKYYF